MNYITTAQSRWPGRRVIGDGRFAVTSEDGGVVYLCLTPQQQRNVSFGIECPVKVDLDPPFDKIRDIESPEERRERRRSQQLA